jgi:hypothetical protein
LTFQVLASADADTTSEAAAKSQRMRERIRVTPCPDLRPAYARAVGEG